MYVIIHLRGPPPLCYFDFFLVHRPSVPPHVFLDIFVLCVHSPHKHNNFLEIPLTAHWVYLLDCSHVDSVAFPLYVFHNYVFDQYAFLPYQNDAPAPVVVCWKILILSRPAWELLQKPPLEVLMLVPPPFVDVLV